MEEVRPGGLAATALRDGGVMSKQIGRDLPVDPHPSAPLSGTPAVGEPPGEWGIGQ